MLLENHNLDQKVDQITTIESGNRRPDNNTTTCKYTHIEKFAVVLLSGLSLALSGVIVWSK